MPKNTTHNPIGAVNMPKMAQPKISFLLTVDGSSGHSYASPKVNHSWPIDVDAEIGLTSSGQNSCDVKFESVFDIGVRSDMITPRPLCRAEDGNVNAVAISFQLK